MGTGRQDLVAEFNRIERRQQICRLYVAGVPSQEIADKIGVSTATVTADLKEIRNLWRESAIRDFDAVRNEQLAKLDAIESEAWDAWRRSQSGDTTTKTGRRTKPAGQKKTKEDKIEETLHSVLERVQRTKTGEAIYLKLVMDCIDRRMKLLGLEAPQWMIHEHVTAEQAAERDDRDAEERSLAVAIGDEIRKRYLAAVAVPVGAGRRASSTGAGDSEGLGEAGPVPSDN